MKKHTGIIKTENKAIVACKENLIENEETETHANQLMIANKKILHQKEIKDKLRTNLITTDRELVYQKKEKGKRIAELNIANKQLLFQYAEKEELAKKLAVANEVLLFQNIQKEKRAEELVIANQELISQNELNSLHATELKEALSELESFSYSVSHDLRAPLRAISGLTQILAEDYVNQLDNDAMILLRDIISNSNKMGELIDNLLEFSRIGKQHISMGTVNVNQLVAMVIAEQKQLDPKRIFVLDIKKMENVQGDRNMLKQVFVNLISNAFKYTGKKEEAIIEIGSYPQNNDLVYYVKDNGAGFDMNYYDKLFGVFQRLHSSYEFDGTGVGLAIVQKIISRHHGMVWAKAKVNEGACFYISLPNIQTISL